MLKDAPGALEDFEMAAQLSPHTYHIYFNRGNLFMSMQKYAEAEQDYSRGSPLSFLTKSFKTCIFNFIILAWMRGNIQKVDLLTLSSIYRAWQLNCGHVCTFGSVNEAVPGGEPLPYKSVESSLSWHSSHFRVCITICEVRHQIIII